ncbi:MAG: sigma-70 family RNA polymerase sigma factor [Gemmataceae bacterium]
MSSSALAAGLRHLRGKLAAQQRSEDSDEQLLQTFLSRNDDNAFAVLVRRHGPMVLHVCRRVLGHHHDAEDAFQATFLVLARHAAKLRNKSSLASWLHGVAYRTALKAKQAAARRRKHEGQTPARPPDNPSEQLLWDEMRTLLDEEIARLPEKYRSVFVLFCLEGLNREETARRLGLKPGTVASRMAEARKRLGQRLSRRGVELSVVLGAAAVAESSASALPIVSLTSISRATVSPAVAALVEGISPLLGLGKSKIAVMILLVATVLGGAGGWFAQSRNEKEPGERRGVSPPVRAESGELTPRRSPDTVEIHGRVLAPDGKPKSSAKLLFLDRKGHIKQLGTTPADGRFTVAIAKETTKRWGPFLLAQADGAALDFLELYQWKGDKPVELRLVKDQAIRGRVVNTEGKPVQGVRVAVRSIDDPSQTSLDSFLNAWKKRSFGSSIGCEKRFRTKGDAPIATTTDAEGRFAIQGAGVERLVSLHLSGAGIADETLSIVNRAGFDPEPYNQAARDAIPKGEKPYSGWFLSGPNVSVVAEAEKPIHGVVTDADTGKSLPGVQVRGFNQFAKTDAEGRYQIHGVRKAKSYTLEIASNPSTGYMASQVHAADTAGYQPIRADLRVKKGVLITGKVIDEATGQAVPGYAAAAIMVNNPFVKEYPEMGSNSLLGDREYTDGDGAFRIVTIPGPVLLMVNFDYTQSTGNFAEDMKYEAPLPDPKYPQYFSKEDRNWAAFHCFGGGMSAVKGSFCKVLEIKPGTAVVQQDAVLRRAPGLTVKIEDAEGRPIRGVWATGIGTLGHPPIQIAEASCSAYGVKAGKPRQMVFFHTERKIAGTLTLTGNEKQPAVVKLRPMGSVKGRLLDLDGKPLAGVAVDLWYSDTGIHFVHEYIYWNKQIVTDATGAFTLDELVPELKFKLSFHRRKQRFERGTKPGDPDVQVKPGECRDLGALKLKPLRE